MEIDVEKFKKIKEEAELLYRDFGKAECPCLKRKINFNAKGIDHIKFKRWNKTRPVSDQYLRLKFLKYARLILEKSGTLQEYKETKTFERLKRANSIWRQSMAPVKYYGFIAMIDYKIRVKIIVKEIEGGQPYFWSIVPFWKNYKHPITEEIKKVFHEGDLETD
jgi:hypothetical protein